MKRPWFIFSLVYIYSHKNNFMTKLNLSFVFVGSLSVRKAAWDIIQAVKDMPDIDLTLIGDGEQRALIEKGIADYHLRNVKLLGTATIRRLCNS